MWEKSFFKINLMTGCWCSGSPCSPGCWRPLGTFWWVRQHEFCFWISFYTKLKVFRRGHQGFGRKGPKGPTLMNFEPYIFPMEPWEFWILTWNPLLVPLSLVTPRAADTLDDSMMMVFYSGKECKTKSATVNGNCANRLTLQERNGPMERVHRGEDTNSQGVHKLFQNIWGKLIKFL